LRIIREDQRFFDVTLVTDDGQHIQAHKIILSAGSIFFSSIFTKSNHSNMLVYLKGISSDKLEPVIDFIYNGEVFITQEQLEEFIKTGKDCQVKGLEGELTGVGGNEDENITNFQNNEQHYKDNEAEKIFTGSPEDTVIKMYDGKQKVRTNNERSLQINGMIEEHISFNHSANMDERNEHLRINNELSLQINEMIEKKEGVWKCKICGKTTRKITHIRYHAEIHIEGISYPCNICSKTFSNKMGLNKHISDIHSELFSCDFCAKTGMNRKAYTIHKRTQHNNVS